jgi:hypothetical protein
VFSSVLRRDRIIRVAQARGSGGSDPVANGLFALNPNQGELSMDSTHVSALRIKHAGLDRQLHDELCRPSPDAVAIQALKKRKLRLKEEIAGWTH